MVEQPLRAGSFVLGGVFLAVWIYVLLFRLPALVVNVGAWTFWGIVGLAIAGGLYGARVASDRARVPIWIGVGIAIGLLAMAALFQQVAEAFAALFTIVGGGLIATASPGPARADG